MAVAGSRLRLAAAACALLLPAAGATWVRRGRLASSDLPQGTHGEGQWSLYSDTPPGTVAKAAIPSEDEAAELQEAYEAADAEAKDGCTPSGEAPAGDQYYNVTSPSLVPFIVNSKYEYFADAAVVVVPSFSQDHMDFEATGIELAKWLNSKGITAFVLKYRVPVGHWVEQDQVIQADTHRAVSMVRQRASRLRLDPWKIGVLAAGATTDIALRASTALARAYEDIDDTDKQDYRPNFLMLLHPRIDMRNVVPAVLKRVPATFITGAEDDPCGAATNALRFYRGLQDYGAPPSALHIYPEGKTGYGNCELYPDWQKMGACKWPRMAEAFLRKRLDMPVPDTEVNLRSELTASNWCPPAPKSDSLCGTKVHQVRCHGHCDLDCWSACGGLSVED